MKKSLTLMLAATSAFFFACGDDSSSDNGVGGGSGSITVETSGTITVDAENKTAIVAIEESEDVCVNEGAGVYNWKNVNFGLDSSFSKYEFVGDTLVMFDCEYMDDEGDFRECDEEGQMMVGGKAGKLDGTWKAIPCMYDSDDSETVCFKPCSEVPGGKLSDEEMDKIYEELEKMYKEDPEKASKKYESMMDRMTCLDKEQMQKVGINEGTVKISGDKITAKVTHYYDLGEDFDDFMNSEFMSRFYRNLADGYPEVPAYYHLTEEDSSDVEEYKESANVEEVKQTKSSVSFKVAGQAVSVNVNKYEYSLDKFELSMAITVNGKTCQLQVEEGDVTKGQCKAENGEFFEKRTTDDASGNEITYVSGYEKSNENEYEKCTDGLMDSLSAAISKSSRNSNKDDDDCDYVESAYQRCQMMDLEDAYNAGCSDIADAYTYCLMDSYPTTNETYDPAESFSKKVVSDREQAKKKFLKVSRKFSRMLKKLAE